MLDLGQLTLLMVRGRAGSLYHGLGVQNQYALYLPLAPAETAALNGTRLADAHAGLICPGQEFQLRTDAPMRWLGPHTTRDAMRPRLALDDGQLDPEPFARTHACRSRTESIAAVIALAQRALAIAGDEPGLLCGSAARSTLPQQVPESVFVSFRPLESQRQSGRKRVQRALVLERSLELIESDLTHNLMVEELCSVAGVSERTLRSMFLEQFGLSPHRYLMVRRLHAVRRKLRLAYKGDTVTSICSEFGISDFGRFAKHYRQLFGTLPSQELARAQVPGLH
ncbi:helix-turn-helix transcriptional regulator [Lysobacter niabensis]|uniref:helix-turn-helix transcriptional regulator n=1 Tax=Agrilutibacter niabensis TaxID=380628 RepID=UPI00361ACD57